MHDIENSELCRDWLRGEQAHKHLPVALILVNKLWTQNVGFQNADA